MISNSQLPIPLPFGEAAVRVTLAVPSAPTEDESRDTVPAAEAAPVNTISAAATARALTAIAPKPGIVHFVIFFVSDP